MRLFFAVTLTATPPIRELIAELDRLGPLFKVVAPEHLHLTLRFVGDAPPQCLDRLGEQLDRATAGVAWFNLRLRGVGTFPADRSDGKRMPRVIYTDAPDAQPLAALAAKLAVAGDRPFAAHVTLARHRPHRRPSRTQRDRLAALFARFADRDFGAVPVRQVCLIESELTPAGPRYTIRHQAPLAP